MYIHTESLRVVSRRELQLENPNTSLPLEPADIPSLGYAFLNTGYTPTPQPGYIIIEDQPIQIDGKWYKGFKAVPRPIEALKSDLKTRASEIRWEKETGGITLPNGVKIATSIEDQNRITSVIANARLAGVTDVRFKGIDGWVTLTIGELELIASSIALHVQECFTAEYNHHVAIDALTTVDEVLAYNIATGWPN